MSEIKVKVTKLQDRKYLMMYFDNPLSGKRESRSTKQTVERESRRVAAKWEAELQEGRYTKAKNCSWEEFRLRFEAEHLDGLSDKTYLTYASALNSFVRVCNPKKPSDVTASRLSYYQAELRKAGRSDATIASYLRHIRSALSWAVSVEILNESQIPKKVRATKRGNGTKARARAVTGEEFDRMLEKTPAALASPLRKKDSTGKRKIEFSDEVLEQRQDRAEHLAPSWRHLLTGLWLSGLRISEAVNLSWDDPRKILVDFSGKYPMMKILSELEKGGKDRLLPITPDFAKFLDETPEDERRGPVFRPLSREGQIVDAEYVGKQVSQIGEQAGVKVNESANGKTKFASAHDLRRSFGFRWALRVMPAVLKELMRHSDIKTTMTFYVGQNAEAMAAEIWSSNQNVNTFVNTSKKSATSEG